MKISKLKWLNNIYNGINFKNLPHGIIISGPSGIGKKILANKISKDLLINKNNKSDDIDLLNHPDFGEWPNSLEGLVLVGVVVEAGLDGLDIAVEVLDQTNPGIVLLNSQHQEGNTPIVLSSPAFDSDSD